MAEDILSQEEVDALLRGLSADTGQAQDSERTTGVRPYDIGRQERIVRGRLPTLELINERFARGIRIGLANLTRRNAEVSVAPVRALAYGEFIRNLAVPASLNLVKVRPLRGTGLIVFDTDLIFRIVDTLFGGRGRVDTRAERRELTTTEMRIVMRMLKLVCEEYQKAWQPVYALSFEHVRSETNPQLANIAIPTEAIVAVSFGIDLGNGGGDFHICLPYAMLEPIRSILSSSVQADRNDGDSRWVSLLSEQVYRANVELVANLAHATVSIGQLMALQPGDVVAVDLPDLVIVEVGGVPVMECRYGVVNGKYALKVERMLSGEPDGGQ